MTNLTNVEIQRQLERLGYMDSGEIKNCIKEYQNYSTTEFGKYCAPIAPNTISLEGKSIEDFTPMIL